MKKALAAIDIQNDIIKHYRDIISEAVRIYEPVKSYFRTPSIQNL